MPNPLVCGEAGRPCPGAIFEKLLRDGDQTKSFYVPCGPVHHDNKLTQETIEMIQEADVRDDIFVVMAHDETLLDIVEFFPKAANNFMEKGWARKSRWIFLRDLARPAGY